jgi:hypothetical protein
MVHASFMALASLPIVTLQRIGMMLQKVLGTLVRHTTISSAVQVDVCG